MKYLFSLYLLLMFAVFEPNILMAQGGDWSKCDGGETIVHCETYDCPEGDTNNDGRCSLSDTKSKITDSRSDALCSNPPSGCGQVLYFPSGALSSCRVRVKERTNCELYNAISPNFTPRPTVTIRPTSTPVATFSLTTTPTSTPVATSRFNSGTTSPVPAVGGASDKKLPATGSSELVGFMVTVGLAFGFWLVYRYKSFE